MSRAARGTASLGVRDVVALVGSAHFAIFALNALIPLRYPVPPCCRMMAEGYRIAS